MLQVLETASQARSLPSWSQPPSGVGRHQTWTGQGVRETGGGRPVEAVQEGLSEELKSELLQSPLPTKLSDPEGVIQPLWTCVKALQRGGDTSMREGLWKSESASQLRLCSPLLPKFYYPKQLYFCYCSSQEPSLIPKWSISVGPSVPGLPLFEVSSLSLKPQGHFHSCFFSPTRLRTP